MIYRKLTCGSSWHVKGFANAELHDRRDLKDGRNAGQTLLSAEGEVVLDVCLEGVRILGEQYTSPPRTIKSFLMGEDVLPGIKLSGGMCWVRPGAVIESIAVGSPSPPVGAWSCLSMTFIYINGVRCAYVRSPRPSWRNPLAYGPAHAYTYKWVPKRYGHWMPEILPAIAWWHRRYNP